MWFFAEAFLSFCMLSFPSLLNLDVVLMKMELSGITNSKAFQKPGQSPECVRWPWVFFSVHLFRLKYASLWPQEHRCGQWVLWPWGY